MGKIMRKKIVAANWKMFGDPDWTDTYIKQLEGKLTDYSPKAEIVIFPAFPFLLLESVQRQAGFASGVQNFYPQNSGAYTGEVSLAMLSKQVCRYALVGHSERRHIFMENENFVAEKFHHAKEHGIVPVLCLGETEHERETNQTEQVLRRQVQSVLSSDKFAFNGAIIAYEPVWAIGTGKTATPEMAQDAHALIRQIITEYDADSAQKIPLLYGGSVKPSNAEALFNMPDIDGGLVGGASLDVDQFLDIVKCIR